MSSSRSNFWKNLVRSSFWKKQNGISLEDKVINFLADYDGLSSIWFKVEDEKIASCFSVYKDRFLFYPSQEEIRKALQKEEPFNVVHCSLPSKEFAGRFVVIEVPNFYGVLTSQEKELLDRVPDDKKLNAVKIKLERKLNIKIHLPSLTLADYKGATVLREQIEQIIVSIDDPLLRPKGIFLIGIPGTGKSYSAKCVAGELGRWLIELNLSKILEEEKPIEALHNFLKSLEYFPPSIIWIDEIDKILVDGEKEEQLKGQLLTILEEFNTPTGI